MAGLNAVLADGYDREVFARVLARNARLRERGEQFGRLLPHAEPLLQDLFSALYKLNTVLLPPRELSPAVLVNRRLVQAVLASGDLERLRRRTALDEHEAGAAAALLAGRLLDAFKREFRDRASDLADAAEAARVEARLEELRARREHLDRTEGFGEAAREDLAADLDAEVADLEADLDRHRRRQGRAATVAARVAEAVAEEVERLPERLDESESQARGLGVGEGGGVDSERRLELGERIMASQKLRRLARLVGAFREVAFEARRRRVVQAPQELHSVAQGADLERLLPSELLGLHARDRTGPARALRLEFLRRLAERELLHYRLEAASTRGPMVICLDGSGSMQGAKELWAKAVALTLMEIARRERRRCLALVFSAGDPLFEVELLARTGAGGRARVRDEDVLRFAEHFPGGGTDFGPPLERAVEAVSERDYRRGDVVFITDGHAPVPPALVERIERERRRHRFKIRAILVDVGDHEIREVERFADDVRRVTDLTADTLGDLFAAV